MKKEIIDFISALTKIRKREGNCTCFGAKEMYPYFMLISQKDIGLFNRRLKEILRNEGIFEIEPGLREDFKNISDGTCSTHPIVGSVRSCFLRNKNEAEKDVFHFFTMPYCAEIDTLILRLIQVFGE